MVYSSAGASADLQGMYKEDCAKHHLVTIQETFQETNVDQPTLSGHNSDIEIEVLRNNEHASPERFMASFSTPVPSPRGRSRFTPQNSSAGLRSERLEMTDGDRTLPTSNVGASGNLDSGMRTPDAFYESNMQFDNTDLSDIPELVPSGGVRLYACSYYIFWNFGLNFSYCIIIFCLFTMEYVSLFNNLSYECQLGTGIVLSFIANLIFLIASKKKI